MTVSPRYLRASPYVGPTLELVDRDPFGRRAYVSNAETYIHWRRRMRGD